eukprot:TRINITY_DN595_c2_g2_i1.p1 TRINITY_DN595_c2_g2~~TRINITY_DN595_c2_g2_i1.p1  ORF type:complete len:334 (+),score=73.17 TRINITY_DN595_c2_g2_i1:48-1049(+)
MTRFNRVLLGAGFGFASAGVSHGMASAIDCKMSWELLGKQDSTTSNEMIKCMKGNRDFEALAKAEGQMMIDRDREDDDKLWKGVQHSIDSGVLKKIPPPKVTKIDVYGKTPEQVADQIIGDLSTSKGSVVVLQGMSGTGKGTTTTTLLHKLPNSVSWSNGNVFRSLTLLAATECSQKGLDLKQNLTPENVAKWMSMLSFEKVGDKQYSIRIKGLGFNTTVADIQNTTLKEPLVAKNIPTVAEFTQGDVVKFAAGALQIMASDGMNVVLEGREATVQYVPTPYRFELILKDSHLLGERRAAQRLMAGCHSSLGGDASTDSIMAEARTLCSKWTQ